MVNRRTRFEIVGASRPVIPLRTNRRALTAIEPLSVLYQMLPHQAAMFYSKARYTCLGGGVGSGKTDCGSFKALAVHRSIPPDCIGMICANTYTQLIEATIANFLKMMDSLKIRYTIVGRTPPIIYVFGKKILCFSLSNYQKISGVEVAWVWIDEAWDAPEEAWSVLKARCRQVSRYGKVDHKLWLTTTLNGFDWVYKEFLEKPEQGLNTDHTFIRATSFDNIFVDVYTQASLLASYDPFLAKQMLYAEFISAGKGAVYANYFSRYEHAGKSITPSPSLPLDWSLDFNVHPMCSVVGQVLKGKGQTIFGPNYKFFCADEITLDTASSWDAAEEFIRRYGDWPGTIRVFGDAMGTLRSTTDRENRSDFDIVFKILKNHFGGERVESFVSKANPSERARVYAVNARMRTEDGQIHFRIDAKKCRKTVLDLENVRYDEGTRRIDKSNIDLTHLSDALGYWIYRLAPVSRKGLTFLGRHKHGSIL